ncbi:hypothetical protein L1987_54798 [Smallanthus sonchifolius]|uniref:Uncharacterized protein n=1 Tax=Smallanthus sonchifolius TaxID=185202 RepID=A0ACB9E976_9ASTR|nr:hypothetical protein L1987_54798 [Smallanthus sonchifolius]
MDINDESSVVVVVVVVAAAGGCGKTTLVTMLCHDPEIQDRFGENILFVTVSETPNFMVIVNNFLNPNHLSQEAMVQSNEDAKDKLHKYLLEQVSAPILLVLDGVQSDLFDTNFEFKIRGYKILVTSRMTFPKYDSFRLDPLSDEDARALFVHSAFGKRETIPSATIDDDLVNQMVKCCKKHPLTLSVLGSSLKGKYEFVWKSVMKTLSQGEWVLDNKYETKRLQRIIVQLDEEFEKCLLDFEALDEELKQCLLDLGLFPGDHRIPACALLDMWTSFMTMMIWAEILSSRSFNFLTEIISVPSP